MRRQCHTGNARFRSHRRYEHNGVQAGTHDSMRARNNDSAARCSEWNRRIEMKVACMLLGSASMAPPLPALAGDVASDITPERKARIIAAAKVGQTALRTCANKLRVFNVRIDFELALDIARRVCLSDASSRSTDVWQAARLADSPCNGWVACTFIAVNDAARNSMLAYLAETSQREG